MEKLLRIKHEDLVIQFAVKYSARRKTIQIAVHPPGIIVVTAPSGRSDRELTALVFQKAPWIARKLQQMQMRPSVSRRRTFMDGETFLFLGHEYPLGLAIAPTLRKPVIQIDKGRIIYSSRSAEHEYLLGHLTTWYRQKAAETIHERVSYYAQKMGVKPQSVQIRDQKKRWGSCASSARLNFNWRCIMAPVEIIDYIIVHELCHLLEMNHSTRYWNLLKSFMPDYKARRNWLKENGARLDI
jgi:predicted metal-dependent hydrolase